MKKLDWPKDLEGKIEFDARGKLFFLKGANYMLQQMLDAVNHDTTPLEMLHSMNKLADALAVLQKSI